MALLADVIQRGTRASQPAATAVATGTLYFVTDELVLERSNGTTWDSYSSSAGGFMDRHTNVWQSCFVSGTPTDATIGTTITMTETGTQSAVVASGNLFINYASGASSGNDAGARSVQLLVVRPDLNPDFQILFRAPSTMTDVRIKIGLISVANTNSDDLADQGAAFRYSTVAGDTGWTPITRDGSTQNVGTAIGTAPVADTVYKLRIRTVDSGVTWKFSVDGGAEQDVTTNVPTSTEAMGWDMRVYTQTAASRNIALTRAQMTFGAAA